MSRFVSLMVPLESGQSRQILLESLDTYNTCIICQKDAAVKSEDGNFFIVGQCSYCAFKTNFTNGFGIKICSPITVSDYFMNEFSYSLSVKDWINAYVYDELPTLIGNHFTLSEIEERMNYLIDNHLTIEPQAIIPNKTIRLAKYKLDLVSDMESLTISNRKVKRAKKLI